MTKRMSLLLLLLMLPLASLPIHASPPQWPAASGLRFHFTQQLGDGSQLSISVIHRSRGQDAANNRYQADFVTLLDGGATFGRWVITKTAQGDLGGQQLDAEVHFRLLDTQEELVIHNQINASKAVHTKSAMFGGASIVLPNLTSKSTAQPNAASDFLRGRADSLFLKGLKLLWSMAHVLPGTGLGPSQKELDAFFGPLSVPASMHPKYPLTPAPVDCDFDASFGFPCEAGESSKQGSNGMVFTKDLPQSTKP